ncbi:MAG: ABC transporter ATP-binding protein [Syntrophomonadaceae bacterium]|nr:ABC transporter ATP-binding protein [Syntrophomonadaceae bacterium]
MIQISRLSFSYSRQPFIENMSFSVSEGEIFGFLGPSGAGKSTLQKILTGQLAGYGGTVRVLGREVNAHGRDFYERIGIDFEFPTLYEKLTGRQNLEFFGSLYAPPLRDIGQLLAGVELTHDADKKVAQYSRGMKSRLGFLRALINDPDILFLDEPTSGLDPANAHLMKQMILDEKARGKTVILTTHNMQDAQQLCDRVAFIVNGSIVALDTPHDLILQRGAASLRYTWREDGAEKSGECRLDRTGEDAQLQKLIAGGQLLTVHSAEPNLGDIFMEVTGRELQ